MVAGLGTDGQIQGHGAAHVHVVLGPAVGHPAQGVGVHCGLDLGIHLLRAADAGGVDGLIAQGLEAHGRVLQDVRLFLQVGEGVHAAVGEDDHPAQGGDLIEHTVGGQAVGAQTVLLVEHGAHQVGGAQDTLHQKARLPLRAQGHGLGGAVGVAVGGDDLIVGGLFPGIAQHGCDLVGVAHQNGNGNALPPRLHHGLDHRLIVCSGHGDDPGGSAPGRLDDAVDAVYHVAFPPHWFISTEIVPIVFHSLPTLYSAGGVSSMQNTESFNKFFNILSVILPV